MRRYQLTKTRWIAPRMVTCGGCGRVFNPMVEQPSIPAGGGTAWNCTACALAERRELARVRDTTEGGM